MSSPIHEALHALSRHSDVIERSLVGVVGLDSDTPKAAISALRQASALRPAGEAGFRLHPRLREYLQDHLQLFPAFQSLAEIGSKVGQLQSLWNEVEESRREADRETIAGLLDSLFSTAFDIADCVDHNLLYLQTLLSTRYGNVRSLAAKKGQNRFYQKQSAGMAADLSRLARVVSLVEEAASQRGMEDLASFLRKTLLARSVNWQQNLSEMQTEIRKELFRTRDLERSLRLLGRMDMFLRQQPAWRGIDADLTGDIPDLLLAARLPTLRGHVEPLDNDRDVREEIASLVRAMPPRKLPQAEEEPVIRYALVVDAPIPKPDSPAEVALERLVRDVRAAMGGISLLQWRQHDESALKMKENIWLVFAVVALRGRLLHVDLVLNPPATGEKFAQTFHDAMAFARDPMRASLVREVVNEGG